MKLLEMEIKNFKGIRHLHIEFDDKTTIVGSNGTGKTTIFDAFCWLLFNKDSQNKTDFTVKNLTDNIDYTKEYVSVSAVLMIEGTGMVKLEKRLKEKWQRKKGGDLEFVGNESEFFINSVPKKKNEFMNYIDYELIREDLFKLITNPRYFNTDLSWQKRREILISMISEVKDDEIIKENEDLQILIPHLAGKKIDELKKVILLKKNELSKEADKIPIKIEEVQKMRLEEEIDINALMIEKKKLEEEKDGLQVNLIYDRDKIAELNKQKLELEIELSTLKKENFDKYANTIKAKQIELLSLEKLLVNKSTEISKIEREIKDIGEQISTLNTKIETKRKEYLDLYKQVAKVGLNCPVCGQPLPETKANEIIENFNREKSAKLQEITEDGKNLKNTLNVLEKKKNDLLLSLENTKAETHNIEKQILKLKEDLAELEKKSQNVEQHQRYKDIMILMSKIEASLKDISNTNKQETKETKNRINEITKKLNIIDSKIAQYNIQKSLDARIDELLSLEKNLTSQLLETEHILYAIDKLISLKMQKIENLVNKKFNLVQFKLFEKQINGNVVDTCEATYNGVPYQDLNNAMKVNIGIDIINTLCSFYNITAPIFIDNAESVVDLLPTRSQVVRLVVDGNYATLNKLKEENYNEKLIAS